MSVRTPSLMTPSEIWAAAGAATAATAATASGSVRSMRIMRVSFLNTEVLVQLVHRGIQPVVLDHVDHLAALHDVVPVGDRRREAEVLLDEEDGEPLGFEAAQRRADLLDDDGRQALCRLVEEQQARARAED